LNSYKQLFSDAFLKDKTRIPVTIWNCMDEGSADVFRQQLEGNINSLSGAQRFYV